MNYRTISRYITTLVSCWLLIIGCLTTSIHGVAHASSYARDISISSHIQPQLTISPWRTRTFTIPASTPSERRHTAHFDNALSQFVICRNSAAQNCVAMRVDFIDMLPFGDKSAKPSDRSEQIVAIHRDGSLSACSLPIISKLATLKCRAVSPAEISTISVKPNMSAEFFKLSDGLSEYDCQALMGKPASCSATEEFRDSRALPLLFGYFSKPNGETVEVLQIGERTSIFCTINVPARTNCSEILTVSPYRRDALRTTYKDGVNSSVVIAISQGEQTVCKVVRTHRVTLSCSTEPSELDLRTITPVVATTSKQQGGHSISYGTSRTAIRAVGSVNALQELVVSNGTVVRKAISRTLAQVRGINSNSGVSVAKPGLQTAKTLSPEAEEGGDGLLYGPVQLSVYWDDQAISFWSDSTMWLWEWDLNPRPVPRERCIQTCDMNHMGDTGLCGRVGARLGASFLTVGVIVIVASGGTGWGAAAIIWGVGGIATAAVFQECQSRADLGRVRCYRERCGL
jgi:hypothetical protein